MKWKLQSDKCQGKRNLPITKQFNSICPAGGEEAKLEGLHCNKEQCNPEKNIFEQSVTLNVVQWNVL